jgi:hypothetical protein
MQLGLSGGYVMWWQVVLMLAALPFVLGLYFLPTILLLVTRHRWGLTFALNLLLGWTCVGWIAMLIWAIIQSFAPPEVAPTHPQETLPPDV